MQNGYSFVLKYEVIFAKISRGEKWRKKGVMEGRKRIRKGEKECEKGRRKKRAMKE